MHGLIRMPNVQRLRIGIGIDRNCCYSKVLRSTDDPAGDLTAIGNQQLLQHGVAVPFDADHFDVQKP